MGGGEFGISSTRLSLAQILIVLRSRLLLVLTYNKIITKETKNFQMTMNVCLRDGNNFWISPEQPIYENPQNETQIRGSTTTKSQPNPRLTHRSHNGPLEGWLLITNLVTAKIIIRPLPAAPRPASEWRDHKTPDTVSTLHPAASQRPHTRRAAMTQRYRFRF